MRRGIKLLLACAVLGVTLAHADESYDIGEAMTQSGFWTADPVLFVAQHQVNGFKWTSENRESADSRREGGVCYFTIPVYESRLTFGEKGGVTDVEITLFNRGGTECVETIPVPGGGTMQRLRRIDKTISKEDFFAVIEAVRTRLTPAGKKPPKTHLQRIKNTDIQQYAQCWTTPKGEQTTTLTWNYEQGGKQASAFHPGFIRLAVSHGSGVKKPTRTSVAARLTDNLVRDARGNVYIDNVPMVDQGQKGYCAAATMERILRYYNVAVDEHEIAVAADTSAQRGTNVRDMIDAMTTLGKRYRVSVTQLYGDQAKATGKRIDNLERDVKAYNKVAKKLKRPLIEESTYCLRTPLGVSYNPIAAEDAMEPEVRKEMRMTGSNRPKFDKFMRDIRQNIAAATPLAWSVTLGIYPETGLPQARGGHMRLIIGYNDKRDEILYSDTWGKGHELKRMPAAWAWTITNSLLALRPM